MKQAQRVNIKTPEDIVRSVESVIADGEPRLLERDGKIVAEIVRPDEHEEAVKTYSGPGMWDGYDPENIRRAVRETGPVFRTIDTEQLKKDLREQRQQDTNGRPA